MTTQAPPPETSESEYLAEQTREAKAAIGRSFHDLKSSVAKSLDPRLVTRDHPWLVIASAVAAGCVAAAILVPNKETQELKRLERLAAAMNPKPAAPPPESAPHKSSLIATLLKHAFTLLRPILVSMATAAITAHLGPAPDDPDTMPPDTTT